MSDWTPLTDEELDDYEARDSREEFLKAMLIDARAEIASLRAIPPAGAPPNSVCPHCREAIACTCCPACYPPDAVDPSVGAPPETPRERAREMSDEMVEPGFLKQPIPTSTLEANVVETIGKQRIVEDGGDYFLWCEGVGYWAFYLKSLDRARSLATSYRNGYLESQSPA